MAPSSWLRRLPKARVHILAAILLLSVILIGFVYIYGQNLESAPLENGAHIYQAAFIFYLGTMPTISIIHVIAEFLFFVFMHPWSPLAQLFMSTILCLGWVTQASFWMDCEVMVSSSDSVPKYCPQSPLKTGGTDRYSGEAVAKNIAVWVAVVLYLVHTLMTAVSLHYARGKAPPEAEDGEFPQGAAFVRVEERTYSGWDQRY